MYNKYKFLLGIAAIVLAIGGCKKWDDHNAITDPNVDKDLFQQVTEQASLGKFAALVKKAGYDKILSSSKSFTVFAPTDAALANLDPAIENDSARLRRFVANHIANQSYYTKELASSKRIPFLNNKYHNITASTIEDATITTADKYAKNGVLHVINKMLPYLQNNWEFVESDPIMPAKQKAYLLSIFQKVFDPVNAVQIGVTPNGEPIYQPGTDSIVTNLFWNKVYDLRDESRQFTFFALADNAWDAEVDKYKPSFVTGTADSTELLARWAVVSDFAIDTVYEPGSIPDTILSRFNTKMGIERSAIVNTVRTSNGIVYIMTKLDVLPKHKFKNIIIQAENYISSSHDRRGNTSFRDRFNPLTGKMFRDVLVYNHGVALFHLRYRLRDIPSIKYKVYWVALHDNVNNITASISQKLALGTPGTATSTTFGFTTVAPNIYTEQLIGEFTFTDFKPLYDVFLTAANSTTATANFLTCDYIRFEPVL